MIRASSEKDLVDRIDEVGSPTACTWKMHKGPVWVDFEIPGVTLERRRPGPLALDEVSVTDPSEAISLKPVAPEGSDSYDEMQSRIMKWAFPETSKVIDRLFGEGSDGETFTAEQRDQLRIAIAKDEVRHDDRSAELDLAFDAEHRLVPARLWHLRRTEPGQFRRIRGGLFARFCYGRAKIRPDADGCVCVAALRLISGPPLRALLEFSVRLRASPEGRIAETHRADAFEREGNAETDGDPALKKFLDRRNAAVHWELSPDELQSLRSFAASALNQDVDIEPTE